MQASPALAAPISQPIAPAFPCGRVCRAQQIEIDAFFFDRLLLGLGRLCGLGWRGLLSEKKQNRESERQHVDTLGKVLR